MSGLCGIVADRHDLQPDALDRMAAKIASRGPDAQARWQGGRASLAHSLLRTTFESGREAQPFTLDGNRWIVADARIDARGELSGRLAGKGIRCAVDAPAPELILQSFLAWGEDCVRHLLGDYSFAIWDASERTLFCARDPFGIKLLFHAQTRGAFLFSNTLDAVLAHASVPRDLDDLAIADYLVFDEIQDSASTGFAAVRRLPAGHCLSLRDGVVTIRRYWSLPRSDDVRYRDKRDYVRHFNHVLEQATGDRLRCERASVAMSGGLDSPALAAAALRASHQAGHGLDLHAYTIVYDRIVPDRERHFSQLAAEAIGIPIHHRPADDYALYQGQGRGARRFAEPSHEPDGEVGYDLLRDLASHSRVALMGWDGDTLLNESPKPYFRWLLRKGKVGRLVTDVARYAAQERRLLPRPHGPIAAPDGFPPWINPDFERRFGLRERWREMGSRAQVTHPVRPYAHRILSWLDRWSNFFDRFDPGISRLPLEVRHPFMDLRVVEYCLSLPPFPWCVRKRILRESLTGIVPESVRMRPKTALAGYPCDTLLSLDNARWIDDFVATPELERYIDRKGIPPVWRAESSEAVWADLRPLTLDLWMQSHA